MSYTGYLGTADSQLGNIFLSGGGAGSGTIINASTNNTLTFTQNATAHVSNPRLSVGSVLVLSQSVVEHSNLVIGINQTIHFTQHAIGGSLHQYPRQMLALTQTASVIGFHNRSFFQTLHYVQFAGVVKVKPAKNTFVVTQNTNWTKAKWAHGQLDFTQSATLTFKHLEVVNQTLVLSQSATGSTERVPNLISAITFTESAHAIRVRFFSASNTFHPFAWAVGERWHSVHNYLTFTQAAVAHKIATCHVTNIIIFTQEATRSARFNLTASNTLVFLNGFQKNIDIGIGGGEDDTIGYESLNPITSDDLDIGNNFDPPTEVTGDPNVPPVANPYWPGVYFIPNAQVSKVSREVVLSTATENITLKRPLLGDTEAPTGQMIMNRSINGAIYSYARKSTWRKLVYKFEIPQDKMLELRVFVRKNMSTVMELKNWKGEVWYGYLMNNPFVEESQMRSTPCDKGFSATMSGEQWQVEIQFQGTRVH